MAASEPGQASAPEPQAEGSAERAGSEGSAEPAESVEERRLAVLKRAEATPPAWGWPERLVLAGLGALLVSPALPWATDPAGDPVWLGQAGRPNGLFVAIVAAALVVPLLLATVSRREGFGVLVGMVGAAAVIGAFVVRHADPFQPYRPFVPGRIAAVLGGAALVIAGWGMERAWTARQYALTTLRRSGEGRRPPVGEPEPLSEVTDRAVTRALKTWPAGLGGQGWVGVALVLVAAGAAALAGPWWRSGVRVRAPSDIVTELRIMPDPYEPAWTVRSGIEVLGAGRSWAVAGAMLVATAAVVGLGGRRRAALVVAASAAFVLGLAMASLADQGMGGAAAPVVAVVALALGVAAAGVTVLRSSATRARGLRLVPVLVVVPGLLAIAWSALDEPPEPEEDGPYRVLIDGPPEYGGTDSFDGVPSNETVARNVTPLWVDGRPGAVGKTAPEEGPGRIGLWVVEDGRIEVRSLVDDDHDVFDHLSSGLEVTDDGTLLSRTFVEDSYGVERYVIMPLGRGGGAWFLPQGTGSASFGPDGRVWMWGESPEDVEDYLGSTEEVTWSMDTAYVADVDELAQTETEETTIDEWPRAPQPEPDDSAVLDDPGDDQDDQDDQRDDAPAPQPPVLGGAPDQTCGLNRRAAASYVEEDWTRVDGAAADPPITSPDRRTVPAPDGGLWAALPTAEPDDGRNVLGKVDPDGTLRLVDHKLPPIEGIALSPGGDTVLLVDTRGRLLELHDAEAALEPAPPPPEGCYDAVPEVAPPAQVTEIGAAPEGTLLDTAGTAIVTPARLAPAPGDESADSRAIARVKPDGTETVVSDGTHGPLWHVVPDGAGGAWWMETTRELGPDEDWGTSFEVRPVHLLANGVVERSEVTLRVGPGPHATGLRAVGDVAYVRGAHRIWRVEGDRAEVVQEGVGVRAINDRNDTFVVTRSGEVIVRFRDDTALYHLVDGRLERLVGVASAPSPGDVTSGEQNEAPHRPLSVELDAGTPPDRLHLRGEIVEDPAGDGVLLVQDGLLARVTTDGRVVPLAQDERLGHGDLLSTALVVLDGQVVVGGSLAVEVPR